MKLTENTKNRIWFEPLQLLWLFFFSKTTDHCVTSWQQNIILKENLVKKMAVTVFRDESLSKCIQGFRWLINELTLVKIPIIERNIFIIVLFTNLFPFTILYKVNKQKLPIFSYIKNLQRLVVKLNLLATVKCLGIRFRHPPGCIVSTFVGC